MVNIRDSAEFATTSHFGMPAEPNNLQLDLVYRNPGQDLRMSCRIKKHNAVTSSMKTMNTPTGRSQLSCPLHRIEPSSSTCVPNLCEWGYGILEDLPVVNSQILYLKSGEIYWLGPHEVMRIQ
jgi:hypothetical protein